MNNIPMFLQTIKTPEEKGSAKEWLEYDSIDDSTDDRYEYNDYVIECTINELGQKGLINGIEAANLLKMDPKLRDPIVKNIMLNEQRKNRN